MKTTLTTVILLMTFITVQTRAEGGRKERITLHSEALAGNLVNDPADREVTVYLPPAYDANPEKHFPVLYFLHGFTDSDGQWFGWQQHWINLHEVLDAAIEEGLSAEMIVVMPNAYNRFKGSMYSSSETIGDWETFVSRELVAYIDAHYRSVADPSARGLAGHSMGGYGAIRLGMKYPEVWSAVYLLSPCCMEGSVPDGDPAFMKKMESFQTLAQLESAGFFEMAILASAAAWAPNPDNPPYYLDLPYREGQVRPEIAAKFAANRILNQVDQYVFNLRKLKAIGMDAGRQDFGISGATAALHRVLEAYGIPHLYESYEGDHLNRIAERIRTRVLPFFSEHLRFE